VTIRVRRATIADRSAWDAFVASRPEGDLLQAWAWGECTALAGEPPIRVLAEEAGRIRGVAQALMRPAGARRTVAYVAHGPVWDRAAPDADAILDALVAGLQELARDERAVVVKLDPRAEPGDDLEIGAALLRRGLRPADDLQAPTTRIVDLRGGPDSLAVAWHPDARRLSRRSEREGVEVIIDRAGDAAAIATLHDLLTVTADRSAFRVRGLDFLQRLANELSAGNGWYLGIAWADGTPIAAMAFPVIGSRAYYMYGASLREEEWKHKYGAHATMAAMLRTLAADGVRSVDMWGVIEPGDATADPSWEGFSAFKRTFGGTALRHPGLFDLVTEPIWYRVRQARRATLDRLSRSGR